MAEQLIAELESSAQILLAPPNIVTNDQRQSAERVFINFQKSKSPVSLCQFILAHQEYYLVPSRMPNTQTLHAFATAILILGDLANSCSDYVKFQTATLLKLTLIRDWTLLEKAEIENVRSGLLNFVIQNPNLQNYVREQLLLVVAIMVKRSSVDEGGSDVVGNVLTDVSQLISSGESVIQTIGCSVLTALLNEFSSTTRASDVGLTWETHLKAKKNFEKTDLKRLFQYCLQGLSELNKLGVPLPSNATKLFKKFLIIAEQVLTWNFQFAMLLPRKLIGIFEAQQSPALRPSMEWHEVFMDPNVLQLFFKLHWQVRKSPDLCHHTLQCLNQLASLNGTVMSKKEDRCNYIAWFVENLLKLLRSGPIENYEALGISNTISRLQVFFPVEFMASLPPELLQAYLAELTSLTCRFCESASEEESLQKDDQVYMEAFEHILDAWVTILQESQSYPQQVVKQSAIQIFNQYLKSHLSPPDGQKGITAHSRDDVDEVEEDDRAKFRDQLVAIGAFGRQVMDHSIPVLFRLIEDRVTRLHGQLQRIHQQALNPDDLVVLESLNEDIHWIVLIIGHVLSCVSEGETSLIPQEVMQYCIKEATNISLETTLQVLASPTHKVTDIPGAEQNADPVVRLISAVFRLCEVEKRALEANLCHLLSPELALTIIWFIGRWSITYLLPNETYYTEMSMTLTQSFGRDSEAGLWTLNFLIGKLESNFSHWSSESKVVIENAQTLVSILNNTERGDKAMNCSSLISLVQKQTTGAFHYLPTAAKRSLLKSLVIVGTANKQASTKEHYWNGLLKPLQERFQMVVHRENFSLVCYHKDVMFEVSDLIECLTGIVDGCSMMNLSHLLPFINPLFEEIVKFIDIYHNYSNIVGMVFQVFNTAAKRILCFLNPADSKKLYECCLSMIRIYAKHNSGKLTREAGAEEEQYQDILVLMQLLTDLLSKDFIDFAPTSDTENNAESISAADVALYGLNIIMPMMNIELLKFPSLCVQYFKLITFVCEIYPNKIHTLPVDLFKTLMSSVELGLNGFTAEVSNLCLDFLSVLGVYLYRSGHQTSFAYQVLKPFLKLVLYMLLFEPLDTDLTQVASSTLFTLICCFQDKYQELVQNLISSQSDPTTAQRLAASFTNLTSNISMSLDRYSRIQFRDNFEAFITEVRGYLCVK